MSGLDVPTAVTFHTVLRDPTAHQRMIMERLCDFADRIIVMSETASGVWSTVTTSSRVESM